METMANFILRGWRGFREYLSARSERNRIRSECRDIDFNERSYYPASDRKGRDVICAELEKLWMERKGAWTIDDTIDQYFRAGMDRASINIADCVMQREADVQRMQRAGALDGMLMDKEVTLRYLRGMGIAASRPLGRVDMEGIMYEESGGSAPLPFVVWIRAYGETVFVKPVDGFQGRGAYRAKADVMGDAVKYYLNENEVSEMEFINASRGHIVEQLIHQTFSMSTLFPGAVNTLRIITISSNEGVKFAMCHGMIGAVGSACSNMAQGGIVVGIDQNGVVCTDGIMKRPPARTNHPDTGVRFRDYRIPEFEACVELAIRAHETLRSIYSIGWDVAITEDGPLIIEGNADWGTAALTFTGALNRKTLEGIFSYAAFGEAR